MHVRAVQCYKHVCALLERSYRKAVGDRPRINVLYLTSEVMRLSRKQAGAKDKYGQSDPPRLSITGSRVVVCGPCNCHWSASHGCGVLNKSCFADPVVVLSKEAKPGVSSVLALGCP